MRYNKKNLLNPFFVVYGNRSNNSENEKEKEDEESKESSSKKSKSSSSSSFNASDIAELGPLVVIASFEKKERGDQLILSFFMKYIS